MAVTIATRHSRITVISSMPARRNSFENPDFADWFVSGVGVFALQGQPVANPPLAELAEPMYRIAGMRINPKTNGLHNATFNSALKLRKIPEGTEIVVQTPPGAKIGGLRWSSDGKHFAFTNTAATDIELWVGDTTGKTHRVEGVRVNGVMGGGGRGGAGSDVQWMPGNKG